LLSSEGAFMSKNAKDIGSLVCLGRRRQPGIGIIIEKTAKPPNQLGYEHTRWMGTKQIFDSGHEYAVTVPGHSPEICYLVDWIKSPSEYLSNSGGWKRTWVPKSWLKLVTKEGKVE